MVMQFAQPPLQMQAWDNAWITQAPPNIQAQLDQQAEDLRRWHLSQQVPPPGLSQQQPYQPPPGYARGEDGGYYREESEHEKDYQSAVDKQAEVTTEAGETMEAVVKSTTANGIATGVAIVATLPSPTDPATPSCADLTRSSRRSADARCLRLVRWNGSAAFGAFFNAFRLKQPAPLQTL
jgi:hypothetical protein